MKLTPDAQRTLLALAEADLNHPRHGDIPEEQVYEQLIAERARLRDSHAVSTMRAADTHTDIRRIEADITKLQRREKADIKGLSAAVDTDTRRDLEHDLSSTRRRLEALRHQRDELTQRVDAHEHNDAHAGAHSDELDEKIAAARRALDAARQARDTQAQEHAQHRAELRAQLPAELLAEYDALREDFGVGAALFTGRTCRGCNLILPPLAVKHIHNTPADEIPRCPECGTLLIRASR